MATIFKDIMSRLSYECHTAVILSGRTKISRNSRCICGSGKRFKRCCMTVGVPVTVGKGQLKDQRLL